MVLEVRLIRWLGPVSVLAGVLMMALAVARGEASVYLVLIIPVIVGTGPLAFLGVFLLFAGIFLTFLLWPFRFEAEPVGRDIRPVSSAGAAPPPGWVGGPFIAPDPVIFSGDSRTPRPS